MIRGGGGGGVVNNGIGGATGCFFLILDERNDEWNISDSGGWTWVAVAAAVTIGFFLRGRVRFVL
jgi:hypothetical protein